MQAGRRQGQLARALLYALGCPVSGDCKAHAKSGAAGGAQSEEATGAPCLYLHISHAALHTLHPAWAPAGPGSSPMLAHHHGQYGLSSSAGAEGHVLTLYVTLYVGFSFGEN